MHWGMWVAVVVVVGAGVFLYVWVCQLDARLVALEQRIKELSDDM